MKSASLQYANALADIAVQQGAGPAALKQVGDFADVYAESAELRNFLASPAVDHEDKHQVIEKIAARMGVSKIVRNFLFVIVDHGRTALVPEIVAAFRTVMRQRQGITEAEIATATELSAGQKTELASTLERLTGKRVEAKYSLRPELLGGAVVRVGDTIYDGSVRTRLEELRTRLAEEPA